MPKLPLKSSHHGSAVYKPNQYPGGCRFDPWPHSVGSGSSAVSCGLGHRHRSDPMLLRLRLPSMRTSISCRCSSKKQKTKQTNKKLPLRAWLHDSINPSTYFLKWQQKNFEVCAHTHTPNFRRDVLLSQCEVTQCFPVCELCGRAENQAQATIRPNFSTTFLQLLLVFASPKKGAKRMQAWVIQLEQLTDLAEEYSIYL